MRRLKILLLPMLILCSLSGWTLDVPRLLDRVNDYAKMLDEDEVTDLIKRLRAYEDTTSNQIVVLTVPTLEDENLEDFSHEVAEGWHIGQKDKDNGILILIAKDEKKIRIEVGYGLEPRLTDAISKYIISQVMEPEFKESHYYAGINDAVSKIFETISGEFTEQTIKEEEELHLFILLSLILCAVAGIIGFAAWQAGGIVGAVGLPILGYLILKITLTTVIIFIVVGFLAGVISRLVLEMGFSGGGGGSFGGSGNGFSGGGGSFGGGGASGGW